MATQFHITRRSILAGLGASIPMAAVAAAPVYAEKHPDADLLALGRQWEASAAALDANRKAFDAAEARFEQIAPDHPEELFEQKGDFSLGIVGARDHQNGRRWYVNRIDELRAKPRLKQDWSQVTEGPNGEQVCAWVPDPNAQARADEIVAAYDLWVAARVRAEKEAGLTAAYAEEERLAKIDSDLRQRIALIPARTMEGLAVKARVYAWFMGGEDEIESEFARHLEMNGPTDETIMLAMVRDLLRMKAYSA
ncbi:hypothetical protein [Microvirga subterranea]|uniref:Secreted protein n=1 Tax=Microvirga subterranea TaxID=186651 RepID=A0A370H4S7_9HYPH|nr:hypothetical protein [Microvirga subterranea]RDI51237.1 hypothetical protein DES45_11920 [Microvirga subterranea]